MLPGKVINNPIRNTISSYPILVYFPFGVFPNLSIAKNTKAGTTKHETLRKPRVNAVSNTAFYAHF